jgi:hypothetical protein
MNTIRIPIGQLDYDKYNSCQFDSCTACGHFQRLICETITKQRQTNQSGKINKPFKEK